MPCICEGLICTSVSIDCDNFTCLCKRKSECLCCVHEACLDPNEPSLGFGLTTNADNKECCKIALPCIALGLKQPERLCAVASRFMCLKASAALPFDDAYLAEPVCAYYGIQCLPECSCCGPAGTDCPSLDRPLTVYGPPKTSTIDRNMGGDVGMTRYSDKQIS